MTQKRYALLSVSDKTGIIELAQALVEAGVTLISTGGTYKAIKEAHVEVKTVEEVTDFPEILDGRVKTLHPMIHGGILGRRDLEEHIKVMTQHGITPIDFVIVNLYPFKETITKTNTTFEEAIENIDIGGPTMLRSAAKNFESVTVVTDPSDYATLIKQLETQQKTSFAFRYYLAKKVFELTSHYDTLISRYLKEHEPEDRDFEEYDWDHITFTYGEKETLRYGENAHQKAYLYKEVNAPAYSITRAKQLHGKQLSYNNLKDGNAALAIAKEFSEPCAVAVKHMNPCGVAIGKDINEAFDRCFSADPISIFGGIIVLNRSVNYALAERLHGMFLEIIIAPTFDGDAFDLLAQKKNLRLMTVDFTQATEGDDFEFVSLQGGLLMQQKDQSNELPLGSPKTLPNHWELMSQRTPNEREISALNFAMKVCKHVKSNAIVISNDVMTLGIGAGQMNRVGSAKIAIEQAEANDQPKDLFVMASDAYFPMPDTVELAHNHGVTAVIQPGGSIRDQDSVDVIDNHNMTMIKTGIRHFRH